MVQFKHSGPPHAVRQIVMDRLCACQSTGLAALSTRLRGQPNDPFTSPVAPQSLIRRQHPSLRALRQRRTRATGPHTRFPDHWFETIPELAVSLAEREGFDFARKDPNTVGIS